MSEEAYVVTLRAEMGKLRQDLKRARQLASESIGTKPIQVTVDQAAATREAKRTAKTIHDAVSTAKIKLNIDRDAINRQFAKPLRINAKIVADRASMAGLTRAQRIRMRIDTTTFAADVVRVRSLLTPLTGQSHTVRLRADTTGVTSGVARSRAALASLVAPQLRIRATSDLAPVRADLRRLRQEASQPIDVNMRNHGGAGGQPGIGGGFYSGAGGRFFGGAGAASFLGGGPLTAIGAGLGASVGGPLGATAGGIAGATAGAGIGMVGEGLDSLGQTQRMEQMLRTILKDDKAGSELLRAVQELRKEAPQVSKLALAQSAGALAGAGFDPEQIPEMVRKIAEASSASSLPIGEAMERLTRAIYQIRSNTKLSAEEANQISELGVPFRQIVSEQFDGRTFDDIAKDSQAGNIDIDELLGRIFKGIGERYDGSLLKQLDTLPGQLAALDAAFLELKETASEPIIEPLTKAIGEINAMAAAGEFENLGEVLAATAVGAVEATAAIAGFLKELYTGRPTDPENPAGFNFAADFFNDLITGFGSDGVIGGDGDTTGQKIGAAVNTPSEFEKRMEQRFGNGTPLPGDREQPKSFATADVKDQKTRDYLEGIEVDVIKNRKISDQDRAALETYFSKGIYPTVPDGIVKASDEAIAEFGGTTDTRSDTTKKFDTRDIEDDAMRERINKIKWDMIGGKNVSEDDRQAYRNYESTGQLPQDDQFHPGDTSAIDEAGQRLADALDTIADDIAGSPVPSLNGDTETVGTPETTAGAPGVKTPPPEPTMASPADETFVSTTAPPTASMQTSVGDPEFDKLFEDVPAKSASPETAMSDGELFDQEMAAIIEESSSGQPQPAEKQSTADQKRSVPIPLTEIPIDDVFDAVAENAGVDMTAKQASQADEAKQAEKTARIEEQRSTIIEADTKAIDLRKQASETEDPAKKKALEYAADAAEFESEQARNMILPEGLTEAEEKEELAKRKAENLRREGDRMVENTREVGMASEAEQTAIAEQEIGSKAFPTKATPEDFYDAEMERGRMNQQATQVETQGKQAAIGDRNADTDKQFEEIQKTFPEEFNKILDSEIGDNPMLKKAFESVRPKFSQETNENGERVNRVEMDRPDFNRPEPVQYSGVAEIGKLVQGNINKAEASETEKQMLKVMEKMKGVMEKIEKKTGEGGRHYAIAAG